MKNILYIFTIISLSVLTLNKSFAYSYYNQYSGSYSDEQFRTDIKSYLDDEKMRQENQDIINNLNNTNSYYNSQMKEIQNKLDSIKKEKEETQKAIDDVYNNYLQQQQAKENENQKIINDNKNKCLDYKIAYTNGEDVYKDGVASICKDYGIEIIKKVETQNTDTNYKSAEQTKNTITLKEAIQRRKDIANNTNKINQPDILKESTTTNPTSTINEVVKSEPIYKRVFNKIKSWFRF